MTEQFTLPTYLMAEKTKTERSQGGQRDGFESRSATLGHSLPVASVRPARAEGGSGGGQKRSEAGLWCGWRGGERASAGTMG